MATVTIRRAAVRQPPPPTEPLVVPAPPARPAPAPPTGRSALAGLPMLAAAAVTLAGPASGQLLAGLLGLAGLLLLTGGRRRPPSGARVAYLEELGRLRQRARSVAVNQHTTGHHRHPDPHALWTLVPGPRLWERRPTDPDFGQARIGLGPQPLAGPLCPPARPDDGWDPIDWDPVAADALRRFLAAHRFVPDQPVTLPLTEPGRTSVRGGTRADRAALGRAALAQLAVFQPPDELRIVIAAAPDRRDDWEWIKWLPHATHPVRRDAAGPLRSVVDTPAAVAALLDQLSPTEGAVVLVLDGITTTVGEAHPRVAVLDLDPPPLSPGPDGAGPGETVTLDPTGPGGLRPDRLTAAEAEALARRLAPLRLAGSRPAAAADRGAGWTDLLGIPDPANWRPPAAGVAGPERLRTPIGLDPAGNPVWLDLKEPAEEGVGPHGLLVGATGSGKSELLRTLLLGLVVRHSSAELNLILIDFKGGAAFDEFARLPHTSAVVTNLAAELPLVDRLAQALRAELVRRQELLRRADNQPHHRAYHQLRGSDPGLPGLPALLLVCDEFSELLAARPELIELFLQLGRVGRSLGLHLLLASQRLEEGRLRGLETHLSYRIGLRTFSELESRAVLGVPDAYRLPPEPGHGYLAVGGDRRRFRAGYVSAPSDDTTSHPASDPAGTGRRVVPFGTRPTPAPEPSDPAGSAPDRRPTLLHRLVDRLIDHGPAAHRVWLPPLTRAPSLRQLLPDGSADGQPADPDRLAVPVGLLDLPDRQRQAVWWLPLADRHVAIAGAPRSGKSQLLAALATGLAWTRPPSRVQLHCLDLAGGELRWLSGLPHVGTVAARTEPALVRRVAAELRAELDRREADRPAAPVALFLLVDGWATLAAEFPDLVPGMTALAERGLAADLHLVVTTTRWLELRPAVRDLLTTRIELRLGDPADSLVSPRLAAGVPAGRPGHGLTDAGERLLTALVRPPGQPPAALVETVRAAWPGPGVPPIRLLPAVLPYRPPAPATGAAALVLPVGRTEADPAPATVDLAADPHLLILGDAGCGKTSFLRALAAALRHRLPPTAVQLTRLDLRRTAGPEAAARIATLVDRLAARLTGGSPGDDHRRDDCRLVLLVDDHDLVADQPDDPLRPLLPYLPRARELRFHLVLSRRCGGAARAMYGPVMQPLRELATPGLVMSGDPAEGPVLGGARPEPLPPGRGRLVGRYPDARLVHLYYLPEQ